MNNNLREIVDFWAFYVYFMLCIPSEVKYFFVKYWNLADQMLIFVSNKVKKMKIIYIRYNFLQ